MLIESIVFLPGRLRPRRLYQWIVWSPLVLVSAILLVPPGPLFAQNGVDLPETIQASVDVRWVLVSAVVRDGREYLRDLEKEDFRLLIDGRPIPIETFDTESSAPLSLVVMQDLSGSMAHQGKLDRATLALRYFLDRSRRGDEMALATFASGRVIVDVPYTQELDTLRESMELWVPYGTTAVHDAVSWLPDISASSERSRRAVLLVTDGLDNASRLEPDFARRLVARAELPVYVLGLNQGEDEEARRADALLRSLASASGGGYHAASTVGETLSACAAIADDLRNQYVLGFTAGGASEKRFDIEVEVESRKDLRVIHRTGYTGPPPLAFGR